jgi:hypothetical protein
MVKNIIDLLQLHSYEGISERVEIAKGKHAFPNKWSDVWKKIKRYTKIK